MMPPSSMVVQEILMNTHPRNCGLSSSRKAMPDGSSPRPMRKKASPGVLFLGIRIGMKTGGKDKRSTDGMPLLITNSSLSACMRYSQWHDVASYTYHLNLYTRKDIDYGKAKRNRNTGTKV